MARADVMAMVRSHFRPEFLNRLDEIILFKRLSRHNMGDIVTIQLQRVEKLLADRRMSLAIDAEALNWLADKGYPSARPIPDRKGATLSSLRGKPLPKGFFAFGEVGLAGEVRPAPRGQERLREAAGLRIATLA